MRYLPLARPSDAVLAATLVQVAAEPEAARPLPWVGRAPLISALGLAGADALAFALCAGVTLAVRNRIWGPLPYPLGLVEMGIAWILLRVGTGLYPGFGLSPVEELQKSMTTTVVAAMAHTALLFAAKAATASRFVVLVTWMVLALASWMSRGGCKELLIRLRRFGAPVIIVGAGESGSRLVGELRRNPGLGLIPVGFFDNDPAKQGRIVAGVPVLGFGEEALRTRFPYAVRHALIAIPSLSGQKLARLARALSPRCPRVGIMRDMFGLVDLSLRPRALGTCLALEVQNNLLDPVNMAVKRAFDLLLAIPLAVATLPVVLLAGLVVKVVSPGPAFFVQEREGLRGRRIRVWKIRTMVPNAEAVLDRYLAENEDATAEWASHMKLRNDPRVVPGVGRLLRRLSIDEFPQLWNVLKGEMSLVGPRPFPHYHLEQFPEDFRNLRRQVIPGMTGLWQITCRSEGDLREQEQTDSYYIRNWSLWLDLWVLLRTAGVVLNGRGAY